MSLIALEHGIMFRPPDEVACGTFGIVVHPICGTCLARHDLFGLCPRGPADRRQLRAARRRYLAGWLIRTRPSRGLRRHIRRQKARAK